jgi:hypothetical protein
MKALTLVVLLFAGCDQFDAAEWNRKNIEIDKACKAADLSTDVSLDGHFVCRPKPTPTSGAVKP